MFTLTQLLSGAWWLYLLIFVSIYLFCIFLNYVVKKMNEAKIDERIRKLDSKDSNVRMAECETRIAAITLKNEIIRKGQTFIFDRGNNLGAQKSLFSNFSGSRNYSRRSIFHSNMTLNNKSCSTSIDVRTNANSVINKMPNGNIVGKTDSIKDIKHSAPIQHLKDLKIDEEVKHCLSDLLQNIKD